MSIKNRIVEILSQRDYVSFAELEYEIKGFGGGNEALEYKGKGNRADNVFIWFNMSTDAADAIRGLMAEQRMSISSTSLLVYMADGLIPKVPRAKQLRKYKDPHWMPVLIHRGPAWTK